jgi:hypothetical protein
MTHTVRWRELGDDPGSRRLAEFASAEDAGAFAARLRGEASAQESTGILRARVDTTTVKIN